MGQNKLLNSHHPAPRTPPPVLEPPPASPPRCPAPLPPPPRAPCGRVSPTIKVGPLLVHFSSTSRPLLVHFVRLFWSIGQIIGLVHSFSLVRSVRSVSTRPLHSFVRSFAPLNTFKRRRSTEDIHTRCTGTRGVCTMQTLVLVCVCGERLRYQCRVKVVYQYTM